MIRVATCVPAQKYTQAEKLAWLEQAIQFNPCDLFLTSQEYFGGGSIREIVRAKGIRTDDVPVTEEWLNENIGLMAERTGTAIGIGASTINVDSSITEDFHYYDRKGFWCGKHSKIALPAQDNIALKGASHITPETDYVRAVTPVVMEDLGLRIGTVFCWQVFFVDFWNDLMRSGTNLVVHPIKFAPRAWYKKGQDANGENVRTGFTQNKGSDEASDDSLGWIRKLMFESEFKQLPIAVTCNTWAGGEQFLALSGFINEVSHNTTLFHTPSTAEAERVDVFEHKPELFAELATWSAGSYARFKDEFQAVAEKTMMRKAIKIENGLFALVKSEKGLVQKAGAKMDTYKSRPEVSAQRKDQIRLPGEDE